MNEFSRGEVINHFRRVKIRIRVRGVVGASLFGASATARYFDVDLV